jgi:uncharacterized protein
MVNDCKLNLSPKIGMDLNQLGILDEDAQELIEYIDNIFLENGANKEIYGIQKQEIEKLQKKAERCGLHLIGSRQRHIGTDNSKKLIDSFCTNLEKKGINFKRKTFVSDISKEEGKFKLFFNQQGFKDFQKFDYLISAPGREGSIWFREQADKLGIKYSWGPIDIGVRLEFPKEYYDDLTEIIYDPKLIMDFEDKEYTRSFCTNPGGRIRIEILKPNGELFKIVNGDANKNSKTNKTNFAILTRFYLTKPLVDTRFEGIEIIKKVNRYGGGKPLIQTVGNFFENKRTKISDLEKNILEPNLAQFTPGDINLAYSYKVANKIKEFIQKVDHFVPGIKGESNLLYAPEIKFYETDYLTSPSLETSLENLFVAGDGVGKSRGIVGAALTGILAAKGILEKNI